MGSRGPNVVVIMADQHRADTLGCAGSSVLTPNLDRLASEGVRFSRVSCQGPLCMPARASFLTERYVRDHGVYSNWAELPVGTPTYLHALQAAGYRTTQLGKAHLTRERSLPADGRDDDLPPVEEFAAPLHAHGFDEVIETGDKFAIAGHNPYLRHLEERGLLEAYRRHIRDRSYQGENETGQGATKTVPMWDATPSPLPLDAYIDTWHGDATVRWIDEHDGDQPFFLFAGFPGPHDPWDAPAEAVDRFGPAAPTMPRSTRRPDLDGLGNYGLLVQGMLGISDSATMDDEAVAGMRRAYFANVGVIDDAVGRIVAALDRRGLLDDTWVVYTSDHGEMAGDHGALSKCLMYEGAVRVPLIVRPPGGTTARIVDELVEQIDIPATVRAIAGAPDVEGSEGRSLLGYLDGDDPEPRSLSISENWGFACFDDGRFKLVVDEDQHRPVQLFDLAEDPTEDANLVASRTDVVADLMQRVVEPFLATPPKRPHPTPFA